MSWERVTALGGMDVDLFVVTPACLPGIKGPMFIWF
jgi:hypothetical protein